MCVGVIQQFKEGLQDDFCIIDGVELIPDAPIRTNVRLKADRRDPYENLVRSGLNGVAMPLCLPCPHLSLSASSPCRPTFSFTATLYARRRL